MDIDRVLRAAELLGTLAQPADGPGEHRDGRARIARSLLEAESYLLEYAAHLRDGDDAFDALAAVAQAAEQQDE